MATWVRNLSGTAQATDADLTGNLTLTNGTAPGDFAPDAVNFVRVELTVSIVSGTFESGGGEFHTVYHSWDLVSSGAVSLATGDGTDGILDDGTNGGSTTSSDVTDNTVTTGETVAEWEGATLNPTGGTAQWTDYVKNKGADGVTVGISALVVTIDYTPDTGQTVAVNEPTETEAGQTVTVAATVTTAVNEPTETEAVQAVAVLSPISVAVTAATETEAVQPVTLDLTALVAAAVETEAAQTVTAIVEQIVAVNEFVETEAAQPVTVISTVSVAVNEAIETESAETVTVVAGTPQSITVNETIETESAQTVSFARSLTQARPDADNAVADWDTAPTASQALYAQIDEVSTDDADYIFVELVVS